MQSIQTPAHATVHVADRSGRASMGSNRVATFSTATFLALLTGRSMLWLLRRRTQPNTQETRKPMEVWFAIALTSSHTLIAKLHPFMLLFTR